MSTKPKTSSDNVSAVAADRDKLIADLKVLIDDAKLLTSDAAESSQEYMSERAEHIKAQLNDGIGKLKEHYGVAKGKTVEATDDLEKLIKEHPWKAVGIGVLAGVVIDRLLRD